MARPLRIVYEGAVYHVTIRGNNRCNVFKTDRDRDRFITKLAESCRLYGVRLYLYCLMTNHIHLVVETPQGNVSRFMHRLQTAYTVYFNRKNNHSGHLFQGRFGSSLVEEDQYILKLSRYVHLNPVFLRAYRNKSDRERVEILRKYPWSSYRSYSGKCKRLDFVEYGPILATMGKSTKKQHRVYRQFVEGGIREIDAAFIETKQRARFCIGSASSQEGVDDRYERLVQAYNRKEDVSFCREDRLEPTESILAHVFDILNVQRDSLQKRGTNSLVRPVAAYALCHYGGFTQREAAALMGLRSGVAVSLQLKKVHDQMQSSRKLKAALRGLDGRLGQVARGT